MSAVKQDLGVAPLLSACHTAMINRKCVEGHLPAVQIIVMSNSDDLLGIAPPWHAGRLSRNGSQCIT